MGTGTQSDMSGQSGIGCSCWCMHPDCLEEKEPHATEAALDLHMKLFHSGISNAEVLDLTEDILESAKALVQPNQPSARTQPLKSDQIPMSRPPSLSLPRTPLVPRSAASDTYTASKLSPSAPSPPSPIQCR